MSGICTVLFLGCAAFFLVRKKLLPRLGKTGQETSPARGTAEEAAVQPVSGFRILSFNTGDFTYTDDLAHCVEYELHSAMGELEKEGCLLTGDPFPIVAGGSILILLNYKCAAGQEGGTG